MTLKEFVYSTQQHIQICTSGSFKRAHTYELLAAYFGFKSYAAFGVDTLFTELRPGESHVAPQKELVARRYIELGYQAGKAALVPIMLQSFLRERHIGITNISALNCLVREDASSQDDDLMDDQDGLFGPARYDGFGPILLDGLELAANRGNATAHYTLALINSPDEEEGDSRAGGSYWYFQRLQGRDLTGLEKEWADTYEDHLARSKKYKYHLREAGRLGNLTSLLDLAERFDDPSFFEQSSHDVDADPAAIAAIAERMGRTPDTKKWLTIAAKNGDVNAILQLIEEHDRDDLLQCWTWVYLAQLLGTDFTHDAHYAINEDGSVYDDGVGGPVYVAGFDGIDIEPLSIEQGGMAKLAALNLFEIIQKIDGSCGTNP